MSRKIVWILVCLLALIVLGDSHAKADKLSAPLENTNLVPNPSFETADSVNPNMPANWSFQRYGFCSGYWDTTVGHTGTHSIVSESQTDCSTPWWITVPTPTPPPDYTLTFWYKTGSGCTNGAFVSFYGTDEDGQPTIESDVAFTCSGNWKFGSATVPLSEIESVSGKMTKTLIIILTGGNGLSWFDDVALLQQCGKSPTTGLDSCVLQPGDILIVEGSGTFDFLVQLGATTFTHVAMYIGNQYVVEAEKLIPSNPSEEVAVRSIKKTAWWKPGVVNWAVLRPNASSAIKNSAIAYAINKADDTSTPNVRYNINATRNDTLRYYCSSLVWQSYFQAGINLEAAPNVGYRVTPDDLFYDNDVVIAQQKNVNKQPVLFYMNSPAHILLVDPQGRRTGYDNGTIRNEIPDTLYSGINAQNETINTLGVASGWRLILTGFASGGYTLTEVQVDKTNPKSQSITGTTNPGKVEPFIISESGAGGGITISPAKMVYLPIIRKK